MKLKPMLLDIVREHKGAIDFLYVDIDKHNRLAEDLKIDKIPHTYIVRAGHLID
jgi:thioredoxin-like negative regulator of GroEL